MAQYIEKMTAIRAVEDCKAFTGDTKRPFIYAKKILDSLESVEAVPVKLGHWIQYPTSEKCSSCGYVRINGRAFEFRYCPMCGAKMR